MNKCKIQHNLNKIFADFSCGQSHIHVRVWLGNAVYNAHVHATGKPKATSLQVERSQILPLLKPCHCKFGAVNTHSLSSSNNFVVL